jgi:hypothetical protein
LCAFKSFHTHRMSVLERLAVPNSRWLCHISCISMLAVSILSISTILKFGSGNVLKCGIFCFVFFLSFICFIFHFILYLVVYKGPWQERVLIELVSEWLLFIANSVIFQLKHSENKLISNDPICTRPTRWTLMIPSQPVFAHSP